MKQKAIEKIPFSQEAAERSEKNQSVEMHAQIVTIKDIPHMLIDVAREGEPLVRMAYTSDDYGIYVISGELDVGYKQLRGGVWSEVLSGDLGWREKHRNRKKILWEIEENEKELETVASFVGERSSLVGMLARKEQDVRRGKNIRRETNREKRFREMLERVPDVPEGFEKWAEGSFKDHSIFYLPYRRKKETIGICSGCGKTAAYSKGELKGGRTVNCRVCGCEALAIREKGDRFLSVRRESKTMGTLQVCEDGILQRAYEVVRWSDKDGERIDIEEFGRKYIQLQKNGKIRTVKHYRKCSGFSCEGYWDDRDFWGMRHYNIDCRDIYPGNVTAEMFRDTAYRYSGAELIVRDGIKMDIANYLETYMKYPEIEVLVKMGLYKIACEWYYMKDVFCWIRGGVKPWKAMGISKEQLNRLIRTNGGLYALQALQLEKGEKVQIDDELLRWFDEAQISKDTLAMILRYTTPRKAANYIEKQHMYLVYPERKKRAEYWADYISMASYAKYDLQSSLLLMPKDLKKAHDELVKLGLNIEMIRRENEMLQAFPNLRERFDSLQKYNYENGKYAIVAPKGVCDVIAEGRALGHCLDNSTRYFERIAQGESFILFLRRSDEPDKPYCSLEVQPGGTIRQRQGTGAEPLKDKEALQWLRSWQKVFKKQLTEEEREAERRSTELRIINYTELREQKAEVRNGKLKGQLLADVLEEELMIAE